MTLRFVAVAVLALLAACGGSEPAPVERINVWLCGGIDCATTRCADLPSGGGVQCNGYSREWEPLPLGRSCSPADCTIAIDATNACMAVVSCPTK